VAIGTDGETAFSDAAEGIVEEVCDIRFPTTIPSPKRINPIIKNLLTGKKPLNSF
jgi:hypothetical protein